MSERFADVQLLRYSLDGFEALTSRQKAYIYCLAQATLFGRDVTWDQNCRANLVVRKTLEAICSEDGMALSADEEKAPMADYLKRLWFANGMHHHYGGEKFEPAFTEEQLRRAAAQADPERLPQVEGYDMGRLLDEIVVPAIFRPDLFPKRVNKKDGDDLVATSACNFYEGVSQQEAEAYYARQKSRGGQTPPSYGLNSKLVKSPDGTIHEQTYRIQQPGLYAPALEKVVHWLKQAARYAENDKQKRIIGLLTDYYETGDLETFDRYSIEWVGETEGQVDFINGFIEVYGDPLGLKGSWEGIVEYKDVEATRRTRLISDNAQWFEDHSPVDPRFKKKRVKGVIANVIRAAMLGGDNAPSSAIGINLPNADWIRARHGSKSITISNLTEALDIASKGSGLIEEFASDPDTISLIKKYGDKTDCLHTDLHECLGHGSGQLLAATDPDALKAYGNTIEEARADLFGLYYMADPKLVELGLLPDGEAYKAQYYTYMMNGLLTQLVRIKPGHVIEEAHMRNRALIARWCLDQGATMSLEKRNGKTRLVILDYEALRVQIGRLLAEVQRIKSEGDYETARSLVERYAIRIDPELHKEVRERYQKLNIAPYKGFINPILNPITDDQGEIVDVHVDLTEDFAHQMLRYSRDYATLI